MTSPLHQRIRANNRVWAWMYYDRFIDTPDYQLSLMRDGDGAFYNAAHAIQTTDARQVEEIESVFATEGVAPAFYMDADTPPDLELLLLQRGYRDVVSEAECFRSMQLTSASLRDPSTLLRIEPRRVRTEVFTSPSHDLFGSFLHVNASASGFSPELRNKLESKFRAPTPSGMTAFFLLTLVDDRPASSRLIACLGDFAVGAEGGTLPEFRRMGLFAFLWAEGALLAQRQGARQVITTAAWSNISNRAQAATGLQLDTLRRYLRREPSAGQEGETG